MQIDTNVSLDVLPNDHPTIDTLNDREKALYLSAVQNLVEGAEDLEENLEADQGEFGPESPELAETTNQLRTAITLSEIIEEVAEGRKQSFSKDSNIRAGER